MTLSVSKIVKLKALRNKAIVKFLPFRHDGKLVIPNSIGPISIEAKVVNDGGGNEMPDIKEGTVVYVSRMAGEYFNYVGERYCCVPRNALMMCDV